MNIEQSSLIGLLLILMEAINIFKQCVTLNHISNYDESFEVSTVKGLGRDPDLH